MSNEAKTIRAALKAELGLNSRQVSVRSSGSSLHLSIRVTIKTLVPMAPVKEIAERQQQISRCEYSGEILGGGNTFVFVEYDRDVIAAAAAPIVAALEAGRTQFGPVSVDASEPHNVTVWLVGADGVGHHIGCAWDLTTAGSRVVRALLDAGEPLPADEPADEPSNSQADFLAWVGA